MAIIVNKVQKRRDIALSCTELLLEKGIKKLTVAEVATTAGVSKGSIYDYFENKEDIVFEIIRSFIVQYQEGINMKISEELTTREKVFVLFDFLLSETDEFQKQHNIYKEYVSISLSSNSESMIEFNQECSNFFKSIKTAIIQNGINKGELIPQSIKIVDGFILSRV